MKSSVQQALHYCFDCIILTKTTPSDLTQNRQFHQLPVVLQVWQRFGIHATYHSRF